MFKKAKRFCTIILSVLLLICIFSEVGLVFANQAGASVSVKFTGDEAKIAGFAQCEISVTPAPGGAKAGYYVVYYTDGKQVLPDYDEATAIPITGGTVTGGISDGMMLPQGAKGIAVFESSTYFLSKTPSLGDAIATAEIPEAKRTPDFGQVQFSFGALSDTHMNYQQYDRGAYEKLRHSMDFFAKQEMDIVIITGDMTGDQSDTPGLEAQYEKHLEILKASNFDAKKVYEAIGNHGNTPEDTRLMDQYLGGKDEIHPYPNSPYYHILFEGKGKARDNLFIFMAQELQKSGDSAACDNFSKRQIDWLESLLSEYDNDQTNTFVIIHSPFLGYGAGDIKNGTYTNCITLKPQYTQNLRLQTLLEIYKDAIVMSGHSHVSFYENANYSDENNHFARTVHIGSNCQPCAYGGAATLTRNYDGRNNVTPTYGSEGYTVEVYKDFIVYTGYNFSTGKKIPDACLLIPVKAYGEMENEAIIETPEEAPKEEQAPAAPSTGPTVEKPEMQESVDSSAPVTPDAEGTLSQPKDPSPGNQNGLLASDLEFEDGTVRSSTWIWILAGVLLVVAVAVTVIVLLVRQKK